MVRVLVEFGYVRELGEGIPRVFAEMEREGFYPPRFDAIGDTYFQVTLRNQPVYDRETMEWLGQFEFAALSGDQKRILALARSREGLFTSREYQRLVGLDIYGASNSIRDLVRKGIARPTHRGSRIYQIMEPGSELPGPPEELELVWETVGRDLPLSNEVVQEVSGLVGPPPRDIFVPGLTLGGSNLSVSEAGADIDYIANRGVVETVRHRTFRGGYQSSVQSGHRPRAARGGRHRGLGLRV